MISWTASWVKLPNMMGGKGASSFGFGMLGGSGGLDPSSAELDDD